MKMLCSKKMLMCCCCCAMLLMSGMYMISDTPSATSDSSLTARIERGAGAGRFQHRPGLQGPVEGDVGHPGARAYGRGAEAGAAATGVAGVGAVGVDGTVPVYTTPATTGTGSGININVSK